MFNGLKQKYCMMEFLNICKCNTEDNYNKKEDTCMVVLLEAVRY